MDLSDPVEYTNDGVDETGPRISRDSRYHAKRLPMRRCTAGVDSGASTQHCAQRASMSRVHRASSYTIEQLLDMIGCTEIISTIVIVLRPESAQFLKRLGLAGHQRSKEARPSQQQRRNTRHTSPFHPRASGK
ncbi:hypothetical protein Tco_0699277 [Tanacetum coccineum]